MCKRDWESINHLLLHCDGTSALWSALFNRFGLLWVMPRRVIDLCACWWTCERMSVVLWKMVPICLFWTIWREKNNRNFEDLERSLEDILSSFLQTLYLWTVAYLSLLLISYADFLARFSFSS
jgi:hypothetical protein